MQSGVYYIAIAAWLTVSLVIIPLSAYFFFTRAAVIIGGSVELPSPDEPIYHITEDELARFGNELELGLSTSTSCRGYSDPDGVVDYCYVGPKFTVYQANQLKDTFNLRENVQCIKGVDRYYNYCGVVEYRGIYHDVGIRMPYEELYKYYLYNLIMAGAGAIIIVLLKKRASKRQ